MELGVELELGNKLLNSENMVVPVGTTGVSGLNGFKTQLLKR